MILHSVFVYSIIGISFLLGVIFGIFFGEKNISSDFDEDFCYEDRMEILHLIVCWPIYVWKVLKKVFGR